MEENEELMNEVLKEDETSEEIEDIPVDEEIEIIDKTKEEESDRQIKDLNKNYNLETRFPRSETKTDFASGIINTLETKKIANLQQEEIYDLIEKRKFFNFLKHFGWFSLADRVICNVRDVEDYSLANSGKLLDSVFIDRTRNEAKNIQEERRAKQNV
jgi:hypothetical protein